MVSVNENSEAAPRFSKRRLSVGWPGSSQDGLDWIGLDCWATGQKVERESCILMDRIPSALLAIVHKTQVAKSLDDGGVQ